MTFKLFFLITLFSILGCRPKEEAFVGIKLKPLYERELTAWSLKNANATYETPPQLFPIKINLDKKWYPAKMRIRGDLSRHWNRPEKSLRIFLSAGTFRGMKAFDLILPSDKNFELEAVVYEMAKASGLPTPAYDFLPVVLNHKKLGPYFVLERPQHIIVSENNAWLESVRMKSSLYKNVFLKNTDFNPLAVYPHIYKVSGSGKDSQQAMTKFSRMLKEMQQGEVSWSSYIDEKAAAHWLALILYFGSEHAVLGDNLRWQYHPETQKFTPLIYDVMSFERVLAKGQCLTDRLSQINPWIRSWMKSPEFKKQTLDQLSRLLRNQDFNQNWNMVERKFATDKLFAAKAEERSAIKKRILSNIQQARDSEKNHFCFP